MNSWAIGRAKGIPGGMSGAAVGSGISAITVRPLYAVFSTKSGGMAALAVGELGHATQLTTSYSSAATVSPILAGESATVTPTSFNAATLDFASPSPPLMMAPACPMRLPGGAV